MLLLPEAFQPAFTDDGAEPGWWFGFAGDRLLVLQAEGALPFAAAWPYPQLAPRTALPLGRLGGIPCRAVDLEAAEPLPPGTELVGLRALWGGFDEALHGVASQAAQILSWDRDSRFCGRCGTPTERRSDERSRGCPGCGLRQYPRVSPAIMVRITRDDGRILLARSPRFLPGVFSVLAGFVDVGEALEQTVRREVREEVGLEVVNLRYLASQSWPFPHSLMIAFDADWAGGDIRIDGIEIVDAGWFDPAHLPGLPAPMSIARWLIDDWLAGR